MERVTKSLTTEQALADRRWFVADAEGQVLGRLATRIAAALRGKNNPAFTPHVDCGDFVIVVNAAAVKLTGKKHSDKLYHRHSGYPGGITTQSAGEILKDTPEELIRKAVVGMLPRNRLGRQQATKLKIYAGPEHPHTAQVPQPLQA